jgi:hypothetical protein
MRLDHAIWATTAGIVAVAISTKTDTITVIVVEENMKM